MLLYPELIGLAFDRTKTPEFKTQIKQAVSGYESRTSLMAYPLWNFSLKYEFLRTDASVDEFRALAGFYLRCRGAALTFYFKDPFDHTVQNQAIGSGDGSSKDFQLIREFGGFIDLVQAPINPVVYVDGVQTAVTVLEKGVIRFGSAPAIGKKITWSGEFYYPCRFKADKMEFNHFMRNLWEAKKVEFVSVKL